MFACTNCHLPYPESGAPYRCPRCSAPFGLSEGINIDPARVDLSQPGIWRYRYTFGLPESALAVSLGEGSTPLVWAEAFGKQVAFKCEHLNPSGSFKDRGSAVLTAHLLSRGVETLLEDSSGNAGASLAAYAARGGLKARIFVPDSASGPKRRQIQAYGAEIIRIMGARSNAGEAVLRALQKDAGSTAAYASHAYLPFNLPGYATLAYELLDQIGKAPGTLVLPAGQGGLLLGAAYGFQALQKAGLIERIPRLVGVQARACAPLWALFAYGPAGLGWVGEAHTAAEGIRVRSPVRGDAVLEIIARSQGTMLAVDEDQILIGRNQLAVKGFYVEPTSAVIWSALEQLAGHTPEPIAAVLTGSGLKYSDS